MFRFLARLVGLFAIAGAIIGLVIDGTKSIAASEWIWTPFGQAWFAFDPQSLAAIQAAIVRDVQARVGDWVWIPIQWLLTLPVWLVFGLLGAALVLLGRPPSLRTWRG